MERFRKLISMFLLTIFLLGNNTTLVLAGMIDEANSKRKAEPSVTVGSIDEEDPLGIEVTKSVSAVGDPKDGIFDITFNIKGREKIVTETKPVYAVVVFDQSDSMDDDYATLGIVGTEKWANAKAGAVYFTELLKEQSSDNKFGLVTFSDKYSGKDEIYMYTFDEYETTDEEGNTIKKDNITKYKKFEDIPSSANLFTQNKFEESYFDKPNGGTYLYQALLKAEKVIDKAPSDVEKVILVISDGQPSDYSYMFTNSDKVNDPTVALKDSATMARIKEKATILTIGYAVDKIPAAQHILKYVASDPDYFSNANPSDIQSKIQNVYNKITPAATGASLVEVPLSQYFSFVDKEEDGVRPLADIDTNGQTVTYRVKIDKTLPTNIYDTNDTANTKITVKNPDGSSRDLMVINKTPSVPWVRPDYNYTVNYYTDSVDKANFIDSATGKGELTTTVDDKVELDKFKPAKGYESGVIVNPGLKISEDESKNIINVVYTKKTNLIYQVNYVYEKIEGLTDLSHSDIIENQTFGTEITAEEIEALADYDLKRPGHNGYEIKSIVPNGSLIIDDEATVNELKNNIITIKYTPVTNLSYIVMHKYEGHSEFDSQDDPKQATYGDIITEIEKKEKYGYTFDRQDPESLRISTGENIITAYYKKVNNLTYKIEYYLDDNTTPEETSISEAKYQIEDEITTNELTEIGKAKEEDFVGYRLDEEKVNSLTISPIEEENVARLYYVKRNDLKYEVRYLDDEEKEFENSRVTDLEGTYKEEITKYPTKEFEGYVLDEEKTNNNLPLVISANEDENIINVYYKKRNDLTYKVEYYFDNVIDNTLTEIYTDQTFGDEITEYIDKVKDGYVFTKVENLPLTIGVNEDENVISVYYIKSSKEEAIPTPYTGDNNSKKYYELFMILVSLLVAYYTNKKIRCEQ